MRTSRPRCSRRRPRTGPPTDRTALSRAWKRRPSFPAAHDRAVLCRSKSQSPWAERLHLAGAPSRRICVRSWCTPQHRRVLGTLLATPAHRSIALNVTDTTLALHSNDGGCYLLAHDPFAPLGAVWARRAFTLVAPGFTITVHGVSPLKDHLDCAVGQRADFINFNAVASSADFKFSAMTLTGTTIARPSSRCVICTLRSAPEIVNTLAPPRARHVDYGPGCKRAVPTSPSTPCCTCPARVR